MKHIALLDRAESSTERNWWLSGRGPLLVVLLCLVAVASVGLAVANGPVVGPDATFDAGDEGPEITITEELELDDGDIFPDEHTVDLSGHATFRSEGPTSATVNSITGDFTELSEVIAFSNGLEIDPVDKQAITVENMDFESLSFSDVDLSVDDEADIVYENSIAEGDWDLTVTELPAETTINAIILGDDEPYDSTETDETGSATFSLPSPPEGTPAVAFTAETPQFDITSIAPADPVTEGDDLNVDVTVTNVAGAGGTQTVTLEVDPNQDGNFDVSADDTELQLEPEASETVTLTYSTQSGDAPAVDLRAVTDDDSMTSSATVEEPEDPTPPPSPEQANFDVTITGTNSPVTPGEVIVIDVDVENTGEAHGQQDIGLTVSDFDAVETVSLGGGSSEQLSFEWATTDADIGTHNVTVESFDDSDTTTVEVGADPPQYVSSAVHDDTPDEIVITFDQNVTLNPETDPTAGFAVDLDGTPVDIVDANASTDTVTLSLAEAVEAGQGVSLSYDGESDNVVNEFGIEALPFSEVDTTVDVSEPMQANLRAIDPTTNEPGDRFSIDITVEQGIDLSAEESILPVGEATYEWTIGDETFTTSEPRLTQQFLHPGTYSASVTITVGDRSDTAEFSLTVVDETPPDAVLTAEEAVGVGEDSGLDASQSTDNVEIAEYQWDFDDGTTDAGADLTQPEHAFDEPGEYTVEVTVVDTSDNEAAATVTIEVLDEDGGFIGTTAGILLLLLLLVLAAGGGYYYMRRRR